ncbi:MAG TPA: DMT family transporter [Bryobacteraceae bacterium]|jgi:drug/metabolite transporter (DMT)-like permease|nr:DMT family transporter [Bryobacteraceae bacterium]
MSGRPSRQTPSRWSVDLSLIAVALIWGTTFILVKQALAGVSTLLFLTLRFAFASVALALIFRGEFRKVNIRSALRGGLIAGVFLFSGYVLQTFGLKYTSASKTGFLTGLYIPLVPLFSSVIYKKIPKMSEVMGVLAAFTGMALMTIQRSFLDIGMGDILVAGCAVAYAFHILVLGRFAGSANLGVLTVVQIGTAAVLSAGTFWWAEPVHIQWSTGLWIALAVTSLLATALAFAVQTWAQRYSSPTRTALIFSMEPLFAWATSYVVAGEVLSKRAALGGVFILAGILMVELKPSRAN